MGRHFNMLRANDLVWSFVVHNYLLGEIRSVRLLYWNSDSTRMPAEDAQLLPEEHVPREPVEGPGGINAAGAPIDLRAIALPAYFVSPSRTI